MHFFVAHKLAIVQVKFVFILAGNDIRKMYGEACFSDPGGITKHILYIVRCVTGA